VRVCAKSPYYGSKVAYLRGQEGANVVFELFEGGGGVDYFYLLCFRYMNVNIDGSIWSCPIGESGWPSSARRSY
jgi:hypothetical protein